LFFKKGRGMMNRLIIITIKWLEILPVTYIQGIALLLILGIGITDYLISIELSLSIFYLVPIVLVTWFINGKNGFWFSGISAIAWLMGYLHTSYYQYFWLPYWNTFVRFGFFTIITHLLNKLKNTYEEEKKLARLDMLTGTVNYRYFLEILEAERQRFQRYHHSFSLAYIDVDNFKQVNDRLGHQAGNDLLCLITQTIIKDLRGSDTLARLGGDEFAILFPETDLEDSQKVVHRIYANLMGKIKNTPYSVSFSIGVITFVDLPYSIDHIINQADQLMYEVKHSGKNNIKFKQFPMKNN
jgi:diguanylate cyclase (GGDEF)-like protein